MSLRSFSFLNSLPVLHPLDKIMSFSLLDSLPVFLPLDKIMSFSLLNNLPVFLPSRGQAKDTSRFIPDGWKDTLVS